MSIANAIKVRSAARKETREETSVTVVWVENDKTSAKNVTVVATGWTARPRVHELPIMTFAVLSELEIDTLYACPVFSQVRASF